MTTAKLQTKATIFVCATACLCTTQVEGNELHYATDTLERAQAWCSRMVGERLLWSSDRGVGVWTGVSADE